MRDENQIFLAKLICGLLWPVSWLFSFGALFTFDAPGSEHNPWSLMFASSIWFGGVLYPSMVIFIANMIRKPMFAWVLTGIPICGFTVAVIGLQAFCLGRFDC
jgi:hypothetical protein